MTVSPPPPPGSSSRRPLGFDEFVAILVAFLSIGAILFWVLGRGDRGLNLTGLRSPGVPGNGTVVPIPIPSPDADPSPTATPLPPDATRRGPVDPQAPIGEQPQRPAAAPLGPGIVGPAIVGPGRQGEETPDEGVTFNDVGTDYWAYPFIVALSQRGIISGFEDGSFRPQSPVTRAEFASMINRAFDQAPQERQAIAFNDLPEGFWANEAIAQSYEIGFMEGYPGNVFRPTQQIPRFQALIALANGLGLQPPANPSQVLQIYQDANQLPNYATNLTAAATESELVVNYPEVNQLTPDREATRAEVAAFIHQALVQAGDAEPIDSPYIVRP